jgi:hypothetical protein
VARPARARQLEQELGRVVRGRLGQLRRDAFLPARLRLGAHVQALAAPQHAELLEVRRFEEDRRRLGGDLALLAAHDPGDRDRPLGVAITSSSVVSVRSVPSSVRIASPSPARRTTMRPSASLAWSKAWSGLPSASIT